MKRIYIILTYTGTFLSKLVKIYTKHEFSHVSISLDQNLTQMYSFGRLNPYNPFVGGFVHEYIDKGTFKRFKETTAKVISFTISDEQYEKIQDIIYDMSKEADKYSFNLIGLIAVALNMKIRIKNTFYCAEFVKYVLENAGVDEKLPEIIKPEDFNKLIGIQEEYKGLLKEYCPIQQELCLNSNKIN